MASIKNVRSLIRALKGLVEDVTSLAGQITLLVAAVYGFAHFFFK